MTDIVERLRAEATDNRRYEVNGTLAVEAADEITRLRAEVERLTRQFAEHADRTADDTAALRDEVERLRAALELFACDCSESELCKFPHACRNYIARAALDGQPAPSGWRPINQPPINPMRVLLFSPDQYDANWNGADYGIRVAYFANGHWRDQGTNHDACEFDTPTHWMPLPPAPGEEEA